MLLSKTINIVFDGDSIALGVGSPFEDSLAKQVCRMVNNPTNLHVIAQGGRRLKECLNYFNSLVTTLYDENAHRNVLFLKAGDNDVTGGSAAHDIYADLISYVDLAHEQGWEVVVATNLQRFDIPKGYQNIISCLNTFITNNNAGADAVLDFEHDPVMGGVENRTNPIYYFSDEVHPAPGGYAILGSYVANWINGNAAQSLEVS